jgi:heavy metal sensor kinase
MTLTTRLSLFFLGALAVVLAGFCAALYLLAQAYLYRQVEDRLDAVLNTLIAAAEMDAEGVEWEPHTRRLSLSQDTEDEQAHWLVTDQNGRWVDGSAKDAHALLARVAGATANGEATAEILWREQVWRAGQRWLHNHLGPRPAAPSDKGSPGGKEPPRHPMLVFTAAVPLEPVYGTLRSLAWALVAISAGLWLLALFAGRRLCRRALIPVTRMAAAAFTMSAADLEQRLPTPASADELDALGRAFNGLLDRLQESFERQRRFTGDASHQLRTPLAAMLGQVEVALRRDRSVEDYRQVLSLVQKQASHLRRIVEMLLFLARADAEARLSSLERIELTEWLNKHRASWSDHPRAADMSCDVASGGPWCVETHVSLLAELVDILVDNACKYSAPGTPIALRVGEERGEVCLSVSDRGCGIAAQDLPYIFKPFYRSEDARRHGIAGAGLGLAIAERMAGAFGGRITAKSELGRGSCFTLHLKPATQHQDEPGA